MIAVNKFTFMPN